MEEIYLKSIKISKVRNLVDFDIPLAADRKMNLIITGRNGSGKTSFVEALGRAIGNLKGGSNSKSAGAWGVDLVFSEDSQEIFHQYELGEVILAHFPARRGRNYVSPEGPRKLSMGKRFDIAAINGPGSHFLQYLVNLRTDRLEALESGDIATQARISSWFEEFEGKLKNLLDSSDLVFKYDPKNYNFEIVEPGKEPYSFNQLSDGYGAVLNIVTDLMMRMQHRGLDKLDVPGIVLIDEVETHLHVALQKEVLPFLTSLFPRIQFIVTTHSPFVISSIKDAVICDLEKRIVTTDLSGYSYDSLIESYFDSDNYSRELKERVVEYEHLLALEERTEAEMDRLFELRRYLKEIPKFASDELAVKLNQLKIMEMDKRKAQ